MNGKEVAVFLSIQKVGFTPGDVKESKFYEGDGGRAFRRRREPGGGCSYE